MPWIRRLRSPLVPLALWSTDDDERWLKEKERETALTYVKGPVERKKGQVGA